MLYELVGVYGPVTITWASDGRGDLYHFLTSGLGVFTLVVTIYLFLRSDRPRPGLAAADAARIRELLDRYGDRDSLGYFALRDDKSVIWSPSGKSGVCYRVVAGVMLAAGDPLGDPEAWPGAIAEFLGEAARHAWRPAVMGCSELGAEVWCREGDLTALELGDEAIVNVADFSLSGRQMRNVRQMVNRVAKNGYTAEVRRVGDIPPQELDRVIREADRWRGTHVERGFSMALGRLGAPGDEKCVLVTAKENGVLRAVLQFVPWGNDGLSLDLMRRDKTAQAGLNDFLIVEAIKAAPGLGVKRVSLNFAMFRAALERGERIGAGPVLKAWRGLLVFAVPVVPDRVALQVQREVRPGLGAALLRLHQRPGRAAHRARRPRGRGVPRVAEARGEAVRAPGGAAASAWPGAAAASRASADVRAEQA